MLLALAMQNISIELNVIFCIAIVKSSVWTEPKPFLVKQIFSVERLHKFGKQIFF